MSKIIGCSFDGLKDRFFINGVQSPKSNDFCLANVILPSQYGGKFLVGDEAKQSRISCGFHWPPDAGILEGHLRRIHVSWAWRLLVDAKDKFVRWNAGNGVSFNISKILAEHIGGRLGEDGKDADYVVIAIPDHLDEFGQESLIKDLASLGIISHKEKKPYLLWRPVAAALAWLEKVQDQFEEAIPEDDFILVVHVGPDCIEFTTFRLRKKYHNGKRFVVPLREQPKVEISLCGCDWVTELVRHAFKTDNPMAIWQVFTNFPEIWETLAQRPWNKEKLPRVWSRGNSDNTSWEWDLWEPEETLRDIIWQLKVGTSQCLEELTKKNCEHRRSVSSYNSWHVLLQKGVLDTLNNHKDGKLRGVILSGSLASMNPNPWLKDIEFRGLCTSNSQDTLISEEAKINKIWIPSFEEDCVSKGAYIYGERLSRGESTYLDTVTQLYILANRRGKHVWVPLLKEGELEVDGGCKRSNTLGKIFSLNRRSRALNTLYAWLKKGENTVFKKTRFHFPHAPLRDMPLDVYIRVASAGGLAQVELIPEENEFLGGTRIFLDYNNMEDTETLPPLKLGFPPITNVQVDPKDGKILNPNFQALCNYFLDKNINNPEYIRSICKLRNKLREPSQFRNEQNMQIVGKVINQDGETGSDEGQEIINKISEKLGNDLSMLVFCEANRNAERIICSTATWLFGAASPGIYNYLRKKLETEITINNNLVEAAGRCFKDNNDFALFYKVAVKQDCSKMYWMRAIWRILSLREYAPDIMERSHAEKFVKEALKVMKEEANQNRYANRFFQAVRMFLYVLRFRIKEPYFLSYDSPTDKQLFDKIIKCLEVAQRHRIQATQLIEEIKKYMKYEGTTTINFEEFCSDEQE